MHACLWLQADGAGLLSGPSGPGIVVDLTVRQIGAMISLLLDPGSHQSLSVPFGVWDGKWNLAIATPFGTWETDVIRAGVILEYIITRKHEWRSVRAHSRGQVC